MKATQGSSWFPPMFEILRQKTVWPSRVMRAALCGLCSDQIAGFHFFEKTFCHIWHKPVVGGDYREEELLSTCQERSSAPPRGSEEM